MKSDNGGRTRIRADRRRRGKIVPLVAPAVANGAGAGSSGRLLERDLQLDELHTLFSNSNFLPSAPIVIEGRAGTGKSALLHSAIGLATNAHWAVLRAKGSEAESNSPFGIARQLLDQVEGGRDGVAPMPLPLDGPRARTVLAGHDADHDEAFGAFDRVLDDLSGAPGVLIAIDDAHWSDAETSAWLSYLARRLVSRRLQLIMTMPSRSAGLPLGPVERIVSDPSSRIVSLRPLGPLAVSSLVADHFEERPDPEFAQECFRVTQGNPRLLFSLLDHLSREAVEPERDALDRVATAAPAAVASSMLVRLASQPDHLHRLLEAIAVLGPNDDLSVSAHLADLDISTASAAVDYLASVDLVRRERPVGFVHPLVRTTAYRNIELARRGELHIKAARFLSARDANLDEVAEHLLAAGPRRDDWAAAQLHRMGRRVLQEGDHRLALRYLKRSLADAAPSAPDPELLLDLARAQAALGLPSALRHVRRAALLGISPAHAAHVSLELVRSLQDSPRNEEAAEILVETAARVAPADAVARLELLVAAALFEPLPSRAERLIDTIRSEVDMDRIDGSAAQRMARALLATADIGRGERVDADTIIAGASRAVVSRELVIEDPMAMRLVALAVSALARCGECAEAERIARDLCVVAVRLGLERVEAEFSATLADVRAQQGALVDAERLARRALDLTEGRPFARRADVVAGLVDSLANQGRLDDAEEILDTYPDDDATNGGDGYRLLEMRGWIQVLRGRLTIGLANLYRAGRQAGLAGVTNPAVSAWRSRAVSALKDLGRTDEALDLANDNLRRARVFGVASSIGMALQDRSILATGTDRLALLQEAATLLESSPSRLVHASVLIHLGSALHESSSSAQDARAAIRRGAEIAWRSSALLLITQAERELRRTGAKPRRIALTGAESLTPSELRVALLAADGKANADIARELVLSQKTVEGHLSRAYRKLGVRSRHGLGSAVVPSGEVRGVRQLSRAQ